MKGEETRPRLILSGNSILPINKKIISASHVAAIDGWKRSSPNIAVPE
jgi:hypothetical protein